MTSRWRRAAALAREQPWHPLRTLHLLVYALWTVQYVGLLRGTWPRWRMRPRPGRDAAPVLPSDAAPVAAAASGTRSGRLSAAASGYAADYLAATYHGKVLRTEAARVLVTLDHDLTAGPMEQVVPYRVARDIVVKNPGVIVAYECPCRAERDAAEAGSEGRPAEGRPGEGRPGEGRPTAGRPGDCGPLDVCLVIGSPLAEFILSARPDKSRLIDGPRALSILEDAHRRGNVHTAWFKEAAFGRLYAICNCCSCCCAGLSAMRGGIEAVVPSGYVAQIEPELCDGCGACARACPVGAATLSAPMGVPAEADGVRGAAHVAAGECIGCGVCVDRCTRGALLLVRAPGASLPLEGPWVPGLRDPEPAGRRRAR